MWRWLVQIGQDRGGMYSYDWLENLIGLDIHSTNEVRDEWQHLDVGHRVVVVPKGWGPVPEGYSLAVAAVAPGRAIVLRQAPPEHPWNAVWTFVVEPLAGNRSRLLSRSRSERRPGVTGLPVAAASELMDPVTLVMTRRMLLEIKSRAERGSARAGAGCNSAQPPPAADEDPYEALARS